MIVSEPKTDSAGGTRGTSLSHCECNVGDSGEYYYGTSCENVIARNNNPALVGTLDGTPGTIRHCNGNGDVDSSKITFDVSGNIVDFDCDCDISLNEDIMEPDVKMF